MTEQQEREAFEDWFKEKRPVGGVNAKLAARDAWKARAALEEGRAAVPAGWVLVPVELLKRAESSLGSFCSDHGWGDADMQTMDDISGLLAAAPQPVAQPKCPTCNDNGLIGGPSFSDPGEGGAPCPACSPEKPMTAHRAAYFMRRFQHEEKMLGPNEQAALKFTIEALEAMEAQPVAQPSEPVVHQYGFARANLYLQTINESLDKQLEEVMAERDARDDVLASIAHLIGAEFTSAYGFSDLVSELEERLPVAQAKPEQAACEQTIKNELPMLSISDEQAEAIASEVYARNPVDSVDAAFKLDWELVRAGVSHAKALSTDDSCPHGNAHMVHDCLRCGAPVCCGKCCADDAANEPNVAGEIAYQLTKKLVIDMPTARAAVDAAIAALPVSQPLTQEQRRALIDAAGDKTDGLNQDDFADEIVRAVERHHGITASPKD